jgi:MFS family permease
MENRLPKGVRFRAADYLKITILGLALAAIANVMHAIILPIRVQDMVGDAQKSTYLGLLTFAGLLIAIIIQPVIGAISDRSGFRWGRRRPFILAGCTVAIVFLLGTGLVGGYAGLFILWCLTQSSLNTAQGPFQAFIPDLAPENKRGLASGVKNLLEIAGGVALLQLTGSLMSNYSSTDGSRWLWFSLGALALVLAATLLITVLTVREKPAQGGLSRPDITTLYESFRINLKSSPGFVKFLLSRLLFVMSLTTLQSFALYYFQDVVGMANPAGVTADLITAVGIAMLVVVYPAGRFSDRIGRQPILVACGLLGAAGITLIYFFHGYEMILFAGSLIGIAAGAFLSTNWALATDLIPREEAGRYLGLANLASAGGGALARLIGPVIDFSNRQADGLGYTVMLGLCGVYFVLSSILIWRIRGKKLLN